MSEPPRWRQLAGSRTLRPSGVAFVDQALVSATSFAVGIVLIRATAPEDYGLFVLATSALMLAVSVQNALINVPMAVLAPKRGEEPRGAYVAALGGAQYAVWLPLCAAPVAVAWTGERFGLVAVASLRVSVIAPAAALVTLLRKFLRQAFYVYGRPGVVLAIDVTYAAVVLGAVSLAGGALAIGRRGATGSLLGLLAGETLYLAGMTWLLARRARGPR